MAMIDVVSWSPSNAGEKIYAYRYPETNLSTRTQLIVSESQEAVLLSKGQIMGHFGPGKHSLDTENLPLLRELFGIPFGGKNPFQSEVWFINKIQHSNLNWSTDSMATHDPDYNVQMPLIAYGRYGIRIIDSIRFLKEIVGTQSTFTESDLTDQALGEFNTKVKSLLLQAMQAARLGYKSISAHLDALSTQLRSALAPFWSDMGIELQRFYIAGIEIDKSNEEGQRIAASIAQQSAMSITGHTWQQEQMFDLTQLAVDNMGSAGGGGGVLSGLMAMSMMNNMTQGAGAGTMNPQYQQPTFAPGGGGAGPSQGAVQPQGVAAPPHDVYCSNCSRKFRSTSQFCPYCGDPYCPCPRCGADNDPSAQRCVSCGCPLQMAAPTAPGGSTCPQCAAPVAPGAAFCANCGMRLGGLTCERCGEQLRPGIKFCPRCGNKCTH